MTGESHRPLREQLGAYALGQLSGERWRVVHEHLNRCAACRVDLEEIAPVADLLWVARDRLRPDELGVADVGTPSLSPALLDEVRAAGRGSIEAHRSGSARRWLPIAASVVAIAMAAGAVGYALAGSGPQIPTESVAVRVVNPAVQAQAALVSHTWGMEVTLAATGFPRGQTFVVTVTDDAGRTVSAGEFIGTGEEELRCNLNSSVLRADASTVQVTGPDGQVVLDAVV